MSNNLKQLVADWKEMRKLTLDLLDNLPEEHLSFSVGNNMGTIGKQYRHIGDVQFCYVEAIKAGVVDFNKYKRDYSIENSKDKLIEFLLEVDSEMIELIYENENVEIDWFGEKWSLEQHIKALIEHEILHHGELIVYIRVLGLEFPDSWKECWGL